MTKHVRGQPKVYDYRWDKFRAWYVSLHPMCAHCGRGASEVDHITPLSKGGTHYDPDNSQALCKSCHSRKTNAEMHGRSLCLGCDVNGFPVVG
jgi:5-methylcytosine-specific restriction protein A